MLRLIFNKFLISILFAAFSLSLFSLPAQEIKNSICSPTECYTILDKLGEGVFGEVYSVLDSKGRQFALKSYKIQNDLGFSDSPLGDVEREFNIGQTLDHPNIIKTYDFFTDDQLAQPISYLVLQYVDGNTLHNTENNKLSKKEAVFAAQQLVDALAYAHSMNYMYLDLHLGNIMLTSEADTMIVDLASFFSYDELFVFFNGANEKKAMVQKKPLGKREKKLKQFLSDNPKLAQKLQNINQMVPKSVEIDHENEFMLTFLVYYFERITEVCNEIIAKSNLSRDEKTEIRIDVKKIAWEYSEDIRDDCNQPLG